MKLGPCPPSFASQAFRCSFVTFALLGFLVQPAHAQSKKEARKAKVAVDNGTDHFRAGRYKEAVQEFRKALTFIHEPGLHWNIARSYEELGDARNATHYFKEFIRRFPKDSSVKEAKKRIAQLAKDLPGSMIVDCAGAVGATIKVDGHIDGKCGKKIANLEPGAHLVAVTAVDHPTWKRKVTIKPSRTHEVTVDWQAATLAAEKVKEQQQKDAKAKAIAKPVLGTEGPGDETAKAKRRTDDGGAPWGAIAIGTATALVGAGVVFGYLGEDARMQINQARDGDRAPADRAIAWSEIQGLEDDATSYPLTANVLFGGAAVTGAVGVYLLVNQAGSDARVLPIVGADRLAITGHWTW